MERLQGNQLIQQLEVFGIRGINGAYFGVLTPLPET